MRRVFLVLALLLAGAPVSAQITCVTINGVARCASPIQIYDTTTRATSLPVIDLSQTWNAPATIFTGLKLNITNTNSSTSSKLFDLQVGGTSKFSVAYDGAVTSAGTGVQAVLCLDATNQDVCLQRSASGVLNLTALVAGTTFSRINFGTALSTNAALRASSFTNRAGTPAALNSALADNSANAPFLASEFSPRSYIPTTSASTGVVITNSGTVARVTTVVTISSTAFVCAAVTCDVTVATLPARTRIYPPIARLTTPFACTGTCTSSTLSMTLGKSAGGAEYLASFDADAGASTFGDADAELGTAMTRAASIAGGDYPADSGTTTVSVRLTSGTGNIGTGAATNLSGGTVEFVLTTEIVP